MSGFLLLFTTLAVGALSLVVLTFIASASRKHEVSFHELPLLVSTTIDHRALFPLLLLPALIASIIIIARNRSSFILTAIGFVLTLVPVAILLTVFVLWIGQMYQYQPL